MRVHRTTQPITEFPPGGSFVVRCGWPGWFRCDVMVVWDYLRQAARHPVNIMLLSEPGPVLAGSSHVERLSDASGDTSFVVLRTSGTTGAPKEVTKELGTALNIDRIGSERQCWLLTYAPFRWAGLSVMIHALNQDAELIVPDSLTVAGILDAALTESATHISLTPSLLRKMVLSASQANLAKLAFEQVTFGGEAVSQPVLDLARKLWPNARLSHVYAATEFGDICSVSDGLAGIPRHKFEREGFLFSPDGELVINEKPSGDLWTLKDNRYFFVGRREEVINVGGAKVSPIEVENAALNVIGVTEARAYAVPSPLVGQVVGLDYCGQAEASDVRLHLRSVLPKTAWPALLQKVERIELTGAGKLSRNVVRQ